MTNAPQMPSSALPAFASPGFAPLQRRLADKRVPWIVRVALTWDARFRMRRSLDGLPDWLLDDMGLTASDVAHETGKFFWQA